VAFSAAACGGTQEEVADKGRMLLSKCHAFSYWPYFEFRRPGEKKTLV